jgi:hypothetical protein
MAHSVEIITDFTVQLHSMQWHGAYIQIRRSGLQDKTKFATVAHSA